MQRALVQIRPAGPFTVHEMRMATGVSVREFADGNGKVFGVAWQRLNGVISRTAIVRNGTPDAVRMA